jgi:outer membrane lipoprotein-sorting protein
LSDNENKKNTDPEIPISAADLISKPPRVHIRDMNPTTKGPAVVPTDNLGRPKKKAPKPRKKSATAGKKKTAIKKKTKVSKGSSRIEYDDDDAPNPALEKKVYADEGKVFRFVGQKGVGDAKRKAQRQRFYLGMTGGAIIFLAIAGAMLANKPPPDKLIKPPDKIDSAKQLISYATAALSRRIELITAFYYEGTIYDRAKGTQKAFKLYFSQPSLIKVEIPKEGQTFIFDGAILSVQDKFERALYNKDLLASTKAEQFLELNDIFGPFMVEGWRAPFLHENPNHLKGEVIPALTKPYEGEGWVIHTPMLDEKLKEMKYVFRKGTADFLYREDLSPKDQILHSIWVVKEHQDENLEFAFPVHWEEKNEFNVITREVMLENLKINEDIEQNVFDTSTPTGLDIIAGPEGGFKKPTDPAKVKL